MDYDYEGDSDGMGNSYGEHLEGLTIHEGEGTLGGVMRDAADAWLDEIEGTNALGNSKEHLIGAATNADLQLGRIGHVSGNVQYAIKTLLETGSIEGVHPVDAAAAIEEFNSVTGISNKDFASQIKAERPSDVTFTNVDTGITGTSPYRSNEQDIATALSMLGNTSGSYLDRGPGKILPGNNFDTDKQEKENSDLATAIGYVKELAGLYVDGRTIGSSVESSRRLALEESITKRMIDGVFYDGSVNVLPMPNETGVTGIVPTQGIYGSFQGTAEDRLSASQFDVLYQQLPVDGGGKTRFVRNEEGHKVFRNDVSQEQRNDALRRTPSLANSLFPKPKRVDNQIFTPEERAKHTRDQKYNMSQAQVKADFARRVLRQQLPTNRDETKGQIRMSGWDTPYGEQADLQNLRNEAATLEISWHDKFSGQEDRGEESSLTKYVEDILSNKRTVDNYFDTVVDDSILSVEATSPTQGTQAWLNQRKGKITASTAADLLKSGGVEERAVELAMERLGTGTPFVGNAHTREGNEGEARASSAFMAGPGKHLTLQEAFFEENENLTGFGVSPDGRLYNDEGESAGLLELKYLSSSSMEGALKKYSPQMQMQMAVTGESQTHFYALDKYTGEYVHEVVKADPNIQAELIEAGQSALSLAAGLDNRGVQALRKQIESAKPRQRKVSKEVGQTESFTVVSEVDEPMTAFNEAIHMASTTDESGTAASSTVLARKLERIDQAERMKEAVYNAQSDLPDLTIEQQKAQRKKGLLEVAAYAEDKSRRTSKVDADRKAGLTEGAAYAEDAKRENDKKKEADREATEASKEASESLRNFGANVRQAAKVLGELGGLVVGGNASGMDEVRLAAETGQGVNQVRGTREALELGGLDTAGANKTIMVAGNLVKTMNDEQTAATRFTTLMQDRGRSNLPSVRNMEIPSIQDMQDLTPAGMTSMVARLMEDKSPQARAQIGEMFGMSALVTYDKDPESLINVDGEISEGALRDTYSGITQVTQEVREVKELAGSLGETSGKIGAVTQVASGVIGSGTAAYLGSKAKPFLKKALTSNPKTAKVIKGLSTVAKATPVAAAASIAPMAIRHFGDVEDDGGVGDSLLDITEFASYGASVGAGIGMFFGGVGAVPGATIGGAIGGVVGAANEAWEYFSADDAVPDTNIGAIPSQTKQSQEANKQTVNVEVTNEISSDLIKTTTNVDGDLNVDEDTGLSTGGY